MKILKHIKAQAALEFLTTYGWAFLIILVMIGTLAYFGILNPSRILPNRCTFSSEFSCSDHLLKANEVRVKLKNNLGEPIELTSVSLSKDDGTAISCTAPSLGTWKAGEVKELAWTACTAPTGLIQGNKGKVLLSLKYYASASTSTYTKESQGDVYATVQ